MNEKKDCTFCDALSGICTNPAVTNTDYCKIGKYYNRKYVCGSYKEPEGKND